VSLETAVSLVAVVALLVSSTAVSTGAVGLSDASSTAGTAQRGAVSPMVPVPAGATEVGAVDRGGSVTVEVELRSRDAAGLARLAADVSTPGRPDFHQYLARGSFARRFGADPTAVATLRHLALGAGLSVASVAPDGLTVTVSGQASRIERLFHTRLLRVRLPDGAIGRRAAGPATLPDPVAASVTAVVGLDDLVQRRPTSLIRNRPEPGGDRAGGQAAAVAGAGAPRSCPAAQALQDNGGALTDATIAQRYGVDGLEDDGADGRGQTVAVYELEPFALSDIAAFDTCYFGAAAAAAMVGRLSVVPVDGGQPAGAGVGEAALDIENVSALAPGARIEVYEAPNTTAGSLDEFSRIVTDDNAAVVTTSSSRPPPRGRRWWPPPATAAPVTVAPPAGGPSHRCCRSTTRPVSPTS
jgi:kumamolisin